MMRMGGSSRDSASQGSRGSRILTAWNLLSLVLLVGVFAALTDIWHGLGRPDIWRAGAAGAAEWRYLTIAFWPILGFHLAGLLRSLWAGK